MPTDLLNKNFSEKVFHLDLFSFKYAPYKPGTKRELAARARLIGLEPAALTILEGTAELRPEQLVDRDKKGRATVAEVQSGIQHIIADIISKDTDVLAKIRAL